MKGTISLLFMVILLFLPALLRSDLKIQLCSPIGPFNASLMPGKPSGMRTTTAPGPLGTI